MARARRVEVLVQKKVLHAAEQDRPDAQAERAAWQAEMMGLDVERLVFLDKTWTATNFTRLRGRAPRGRRLVDKTPHGHWKTTTFVAALRSDGLTAPTVVDGPLDGSLFLAYVRQQLAPTLREGDIVVMDNLQSQSRRRARGDRNGRREARVLAAV